MKLKEKLDLSKLVGFDAMAKELDRVDFQNETFAAKLGAKVGKPGDVVEPVPLEFNDR